MLLAVVPGHVKFELYSWLSAQFCGWAGARGPYRPMWTRFVSRPSAGGRYASVSLVWRSAAQERVRTKAVVPDDILKRLVLESAMVERHDVSPEAFILHRSDKALDDGDAAMLAYGAETRLDLATATPAFERFAPELHAFVADDVLGLGFVLADRLVEELADLAAVRLLVEDCDSHYAAREVIHGDGKPPTEWPALRQGQRHPRCPEPANWNRSQVHMPDMVGALGCYKTSWLGVLVFLNLAGRTKLSACGLQHPADGRSAQVQAGTG